MIDTASKNTQALLRESFLPVMLVLVGLFTTITVVKFKASIDAERIITIHIRNISGSVEAEDTEGVESLTGESFKSDTALAESPLQLKVEKLIEESAWDDANRLISQQLAKERNSINLNLLGYLYLKQEKYDDALRVLNEALKTPPVYPETFLRRGMVLTRLERVEDAISSYKQLISLVPHHFAAHFNLGTAYLEAGNIGKAIKVLEKASTLSGGPRKAKALYNLGLAYKRKSGTRNRDKAIKAFQSAIRLRPDYVRARFAIAALQPGTEQGEENALDQYEKVLQLIPNYPPAYFQMGMFYSKRKNIKKAVEMYQQAIQYDPGYQKAKYNLGTLYLSSKRWGDARLLFEQLLQSGKNNAAVHFQLGRAAYAEKDYQKALHEYQLAVAGKKERYPEAYLNMGLVYKRIKQYDMAIEAYMTALKQKKNYSRAWYNLGLIYKELKRDGDAEKAFLAAIEQNNSYAQAWFNLGVLYVRINQEDKAINAYKNAVKVKPDYIKAQLNLAVRYAKKNQLQNAIQLYQSILAADKEYAPAWTNMGIAYFKLGDYENAKQALNKSILLEPENTMSKSTLANIYVAETNYDKAIKLFKEAVNVASSDPAIRMQYAKALRMSGNKIEALTELKKAKSLGADQGLLEQEFKFLGQ